MKHDVYYNEFDREKAAWLRELIRCGHIAPGDVDERDIRDVVPAELSGYRQCHFFAGVGIWSYALRNAGWDDSRRVWTVSCPCQPFSAAGQGKGFADERHLWPAWFHIASQCRPDVVFGEQVESEDGLTWLDLVWTDMEALGYAFGPVVVPAAGVGAPHGRHRIWFVADALRDGGRGRGSGKARATADGVQGSDGERQRIRTDARPGRSALSGDLADAERERRQRREGAEGGREPDREATGRPQGHDGPVGVHETRPLGVEYAESHGRIEGGAEPDGRSLTGGCGDGPLSLGDSDRDGRDQCQHPGGLGREAEEEPQYGRQDEREGSERPVPVGNAGVALGDAGSERLEERGCQPGDDGSQLTAPERASGPTNGFWADAEWLPCSDGKARAVEPGTFPLAHGAPARVVRLRGYGDGIVAPAAEEVIRAYMNREKDADE